MEDHGTLQLARELVDRTCGFAIDIGGSVVKIVYRPKTSDNAGKDEKTRTVRLASFAKPQLEAALDFVRDNCDITHTENGNPKVAILTGVGCHQYSDLIDEKLKVKSEIVTEMDCFVKAFMHLCSTFPKQSVVDGAPAEALRKAMKRVGILSGRIDTLKKYTDMHLENIDTDGMNQEEEATPAETDKPFKESHPDIFPCIFTMCGSGAAYMLVRENGSIEILEGTNWAGKTFLGLGSLLCGERKTFPELMELAKKGNHRGVDVYGSDLIDPSKPQDNIYSQMSQDDPEADSIVFCFGKGVKSKPGDFSKEDLVAAALYANCLNMVQGSSAVAITQGVKQIFFCGSFMNSELVREFISEELLYKCKLLALFKPGQPEINFNFVKGGGHLGALGAFMQEPTAKTTPQAEAGSPSATESSATSKATENIQFENGWALAQETVTSTL